MSRSVYPVHEEWFNAMPINMRVKRRYPNLEAFDIYKNPSVSESKDISDNQDDFGVNKLRGFVDRGGLGDLYAWSPEAEHKEAYSYIKQKMKGEAVGVYVYWTGSVEVSEYTIHNLTHRSLELEDVYKRWKGFWQKNLKKNKNLPRAIGKGSLKDVYMPFYEYGVSDMREKTVEREIAKRSHKIEIVGEKWIGDTWTHKAYFSGKPETTDIFKNPSKKETSDGLKLAGHSGLRGYVDKSGKGDVYIFPSEAIVHENVLDWVLEHTKGDGVPFVFQDNNKLFISSDPYSQTNTWGGTADRMKNEYTPNLRKNMKVKASFGSNVKIVSK